MVSNAYGPECKNIASHELLNLLWFLHKQIWCVFLLHHSKWPVQLLHHSNRPILLHHSNRSILLHHSNRPILLHHSHWPILLHQSHWPVLLILDSFCNAGKLYYISCAKSSMFFKTHSMLWLPKFKCQQRSVTAVLLTLFAFLCYQQIQLYSIA